MFKRGITHFSHASGLKHFQSAEKHDFFHIRSFMEMFAYKTNGIQTKQQWNLIMVLAMRRLFYRGRGDFVLQSATQIDK